MAGSFGERLRQARETAGKEIRDVAETTRIQRRYLEALEAEDWAALPTGVIGRGFVRVVAKELGISSSELLELYRAARGQHDAEETGRGLPEAELQVSLRSRKRAPRVLLGAGGVVLLLVLGAAWYAWSPRTPPEVGPAGSTEPRLPVAPAKPVPPPPAESTPPPEALATPPPQAAAAPSPAPAEAPMPATGLQKLELEALQKVWIRVVPDGGAPQVKILKAGERASWTPKRTIDVKIGNAAGMRLLWNGRPLELGSGARVVSLSLPRDAAARGP